MQTLPAVMALLAAQQDSSRNLQDNSGTSAPFICHVCSCDHCDDDKYAMGNTNGIWTLPDYLQQESGIDSVSCATLHDQDVRGLVPQNICLDDIFRLLPTFREACGCPALPSRPSRMPTRIPSFVPTPFPSGTPTPAPSSAPTFAPTVSPSLAPTASAPIPFPAPTPVPPAPVFDWKRFRFSQLLTLLQERLRKLFRLGRN